MSVIQPPTLFFFKYFDPKPSIVIEKGTVIQLRKPILSFYIYATFLLRVPYVSNLVENRSEHVRCVMMFKSVIAVQKCGPEKKHKEHLYEEGKFAEITIG